MSSRRRPCSIGGWRSIAVEDGVGSVDPEGPGWSALYALDRPLDTTVELAQRLGEAVEGASALSAPFELMP